jgi:ribonuclease HII
VNQRQAELEFTVPTARGGLLAGVDEAGRGPLAGPVVAAAVILDPRRTLAGLDDSKRLSERRREQLAEVIRAQSLSWSIAWADPAEIDARNILGATLLAMARAVAGLSRSASLVLVDGDKQPRLDVVPQPQVQAVVRGDALVPAISAASILAKTYRDRWMVALAERFPGYGLELHKGYPTPAHLDSLQALGPCAIHRRSFAPVSRSIAAMVGAGR